MTKRYCLLVALLLALLALNGAARADWDEIYYGDMMVVNCEEWVSLREVPGTGGDRLAKVPLGAMVAEAEWVPLYDQYVYCRFGGQWGYVLSKYLRPEDEGGFAVVLDETRDGLEVVAVRSYEDSYESLLAYAVDEQGKVVWSHRTVPVEITELDRTAAFIGGTAQEPRVMVYNTEEGLTALDLFTGEALWTLARQDVWLGASLSCAMTEDGTMYIGGYYGPDPVAIDVDGRVLWQADSGSDDIFWLYEIELTDEGVAAHYDSFPDSTVGGWVVYGLDGTVKELCGE
ncbi:MAG: hypothetical protein J5602_01910 [Clostridia bacterium]|nr:hypothetical protein [Clostridia bacterium]MBO4884046.1 hypothetical protein [Clostridia bacterium]